ncbi:Choline-sulfatase [Pontiella desulfatans]|uniref:Choline-sulfatase n=1 Tax=Pontiella desulfatans TaxID=2750659 RepID=A0A6C2TW47_PONDE|nr:sulfatase [Pontiella desulfatans]SPS73614.1 sulfatase S1_7 [Kiritimatiellales bacterium]VGO11762.1 Choline-sulfatase [Pontiella desulfatans]
MKSKNTIRILLFSLLIGAAAQASAAKDRMNVLFIAVDDLNDWTGLLEGHPQAYTPNLDRLAKRGVYFTNAHCAAPVCTTSRQSLLSGLAPTTSGWVNSTPNNAEEYDAVLAGRKPLPTLFRDNGYATMAAGKIYHKGVKDFDYPLWDETLSSNYGFRKGAPWYRNSHFNPFPPDGGAIYQAHGGRVKGDTLCWAALEKDEMPKKGMPDEQIADWAIGQLGQKHEKPFFMAVGFLRPHNPYTAPKKYFERYPLESIKVPEVPADEFNDIPLYGKAMIYGTLPKGDHKEVLDISPTYWKELVRAYLACTTFVDDQIGRVLDALDESKYADHTIVVLWSDHGQHLGEKRHWRKQALWEESTRVPLFFSVPGMPSNGELRNQPVSLLDIFPTLSELCGLPGQDLDGVSLVPMLKNDEAERGAPVVTTRYNGNHAVRSRDWRYIRYRDGTEELYDHRKDPGEHKNLASNPEFADVLKAQREWLLSNEAAADATADYPTDSYDRCVDDFKTKGVPDWLQ